VTKIFYQYARFDIVFNYSNLIMKTALQIFTISLIFLGVTSLQAQVDGDVIITEIMQNPSAVSDSNGEWIELYNATNADIDLGGWVISDNDNDSHTIVGTLILPAQDYIVLGKNSDVSTNGGVPVNYEYSSFTLSNSFDEVIIDTPGGIEIDRVQYDDGGSFPDPTGASMMIGTLTNDNSIGSNWYENITDVYGDGDFGTPGFQNDLPLGSLIISEIMYNPLAVDDQFGEWIEIYNSSGIDYSGNLYLSKTIDLSNDHQYMGGTFIGANAYQVFGASDDQSINGGVPLVFLLNTPTGSFLPLLDNGDVIYLISGYGTIHDQVAYDNGTSFPFAEGASIAAQVLTATENDLGSNWVASDIPWTGSAGDFGSPGQENPAPLPVQLISFEATPMNSRATLLNWITATEEQNDYFSIEHSFDGFDFKEIGRMNGAGTTFILEEYSFVHSELESGRHYYRLKQVDINGRFTYSEIAAVNIFNNNLQEFVVYPNPASDHLMIQSNQTIANKTQLQILNQQGQLMKAVETSNESELIEIDLAKLPNGIYYIQFFDRSGTTSKKFVKQT